MGLYPQSWERNEQGNHDQGRSMSPKSKCPPRTHIYPILRDRIKLVSISLCFWEDHEYIHTHMMCVQSYIDGELFIFVLLLSSLAR